MFEFYSCYENLHLELVSGKNNSDPNPLNMQTGDKWAGREKLIFSFPHLPLSQMRPVVTYSCNDYFDFMSAVLIVFWELKGGNL